MKRQHLFLLAGILLCQTAIYYGYAQHEVIPQGPPWNTFPAHIGGWSLEQEVLPDEASLAQLQPDDYLSRDYISGSQRVDLFVAYFKTERTGHAPHSPKACLPGAGWQPVSADLLPIAVPQSGVTIDANQYVVRRGDVDMAVFYWYQNARRTIANEVMFQVYAVPELLYHGRTDITFIRVITEITNGLDNARNTALDFIRQIYPEIKAHIPAA
jgi:EpsI family protein